MKAITCLLSAAVRGYQLLLSPVLPAACRYHPSCSRYAREALARHGAIMGSWLTLRRLARCHPWSDGGYDPVPASLAAGAAAPERRARHGHAS